MTETNENFNKKTKIAGAVVAALIGVPTAVGLFGGDLGGGQSGSTGEQVAVLDNSAAEAEAAAKAEAEAAAAKAEEEAAALAEAEAAKKAEEEATAMAEAEAAKKAEEEAAAMAEAEAAKKAEEEAAAMAEAEAAKKAEEEAAAMAEAEAAAKAEEEAAAMAEAEAAKMAEEEAAAADESTQAGVVTYTAPAKKVTYTAPVKAVTYTAPAKKTAAVEPVVSSWEIAGFDGLSTGTSYADAREMLVEAGWSPRELTDETRLDALDDNEKGLVDSGFAELEGCETYARTVCRFEFLDGEGKIAAVLTAGKETPSVIDAFVMDVR